MTTPITDLTISASLFTHDNTDYRSNYQCITIHTQQYPFTDLHITISASLFTHNNTNYRSNYQCITIHTQQYLLYYLIHKASELHTRIFSNLLAMPTSDTQHGLSSRYICKSSDLLQILHEQVMFENPLNNTMSFLPGGFYYLLSIDL